MRLKDVSSANGAPMGRPEYLPDPDTEVELQIEKVRFEDGDYDYGGAYWGAPANLWHAEGNTKDGDMVLLFVRAPNMKAAKEAIIERLEGVAVTFSSSSNPINVEDALVSYMGCALWSSTFNDEEMSELVDIGDDEVNDEFIDLDKYLSVDDLGPEIRSKMMDDIKSFLAKCKEQGLDLDNWSELRSRFEIGEDELVLDGDNLGHNFWLSRNGHGTGFWDRGWGDLGKKLHEIAKSFGEVYLESPDFTELYNKRNNHA
jgi:hypothetical protein